MEHNVKKRALIEALVALGVILVALAFGSGVVGKHTNTVTDRVHAIEAVVRCPSCEDLSVAESEASSAIAVKHQIVSLVKKGDSTQSIENTLEDEYGPTILLRPPVHGLLSLVWYVPLAGAIATIIYVALLFKNRAKAFQKLTSEARPTDA